MANYTIRFGCGHTGTVGITGSNRAERVAEAEASALTKTCVNCTRKAEVAAARAAGDEALANKLIARNRRSGARQARNTLIERYGVDGAERIAERRGFRLAE